ncbi:unnamed protein product [Paramecium pentaurelia]|uniref:PPM-type phosphatase domain-containing protein n=1 Tax=Paramecium pentaurelia TaxID=43138 RepID=A0A8S1TEF5_9CILI|nr:unnamed protein product [Paramecium pentaurelia]
MLNIVDKLPSIQKQHMKRIQTEVQCEEQLIKVAAKTLPGQNNKKKLKINQDSLAIKQNLCNQNDCHLFGIFDGHGQNGHLVSQFISRQLPKTIENLLMQNYINNPNLLSQSLSLAFQQVEHDLVDKTNIACNFSGSTAVLILLIESRIYCANVGDSRAVYFYKFQDLWYNRPLSYDHKPNKTFELKRIIKLGGRVEQSLIDGKRQGPFRVWLTNEDVPGLAMSRSFGDVAAKSVGVIAEPEILRYKIQNSGFILLASDGLWDKMDFESIQNILDNFDPPLTQVDMELIAQKILGEAYSKWDRKDYGRDDITLILVHVQI